MKRSPGLVTPGSSHPVDYTWPLQIGTAAEIPDPEATRQSLGRLNMTPSTTFPLCVASIDGNRDLLEQQNPRSTGTACNDRLSWSEWLIPIADDCRGWFDRLKPRNVRAVFGKVQVFWSE